MNKAMVVGAVTALIVSNWASAEAGDASAGSRAIVAAVADSARPATDTVRDADRKPVKNQDLWQRLEELAAAHRIEWRWVPGHAGVPGNERVDRLANQAIEALVR